MPTASMREESVGEWLKNMNHVAGILDGIIGVACPAQYQYCDVQLTEVRRAHPEARRWPFTFGAAQVMINRETIYHRDPSSDGHFIDLLLTLGDYGDQAYLGLRTFGVSVPYTTGTIQLNLARYIEHGVPRVQGNRVGIALLSKSVV